MEVAPFFVGLAAAVARREIIPADSLTKLSDVMRFLAVTAQSSSSTQMYAVDPVHVGYLKRSIAGVDLFVPFHLVRYFPADYILTAVIQAAREISLHQTNPICISGSTVFLGVPVATADLDFCEYAACSEQEVVAGLHRLWTTVSENFLLVSTRISSKVSPAAKTSETSYRIPFPACDSSVAAQVARHFSLTEPSVKLDGVHGSAELSVLQISNRVLPLDRPGSAGLSFVFQEAVVVAAGGPPRGLVEVADLGAYLDFLKREAQGFLTNNPLKALKRCLSFFLLTNLQEPAETIIGMLTSASVTVVTMAKRRRELDGIVELAKHPLDTGRNATPELPADVVARAEQVLQPLLDELATEMVAQINRLYRGVA